MNPKKTNRVVEENDERVLLSTSLVSTEQYASRHATDKRTEMRSRGARDKELASVRIWAAVGHGHESWSVVFVSKVFVGKGRTVDTEFPRAWRKPIAITQNGSQAQRK